MLHFSGFAKPVPQIVSSNTIPSKPCEVGPGGVINPIWLMSKPRLRESRSIVPDLLDTKQHQLSLSKPCILSMVSTPLCVRRLWPRESVSGWGGRRK